MNNKPGMYAKKEDLKGQQSSAAATEDFDPIEFIAKNTLSRTIKTDKYTAEQKFEVCYTYFLTQNMKKVEEVTGVPYASCQGFKNKSAWWKEVYAYIKRMKNEELDGKLSAAIDLATKELVDRLTEGDEHITKDGDIVKRRVSAKDSATIVAILFDKRAMLRGDPSTNMKKESTDSLLKSLGKEFAKFAGKDTNTKEETPKIEAEELPGPILQ